MGARLCLKPAWEQRELGEVLSDMWPTRANMQNTTLIFIFHRLPAISPDK